MSEITNNNGYKITIKDKQIKTLEQFIEEAQLDMNEWEILKCQANKWDVNMKIKVKGEEIPVLRENWQTKLVLEKKLHLPDIKGFKNSLLEDLKAASPHVPKVKQTNFEDTGNMVEFNITDLHVGKIGLDILSPNGKWGTKRAFKDFQKIVDYYISTIKNFDIRPEKILLVLGNDIINTNTANPFPQTVAGTPQSQDDYGPIIFRFVKYLLVETIFKFYNVVPNIVIKMIPGNHDEDKVFYLGEVLDAFFYNNENIEVDNSMLSRKYYRWGINLLGFAHGNHKAEGLKRLSYLMQHENPKEWSRSKIREWHLGDIHHNKKVEILPEEDSMGINIRYMRSPMVGEPWEMKQGYVSSKGADLIVWNRKNGKVLEIPYNNF